MLIAINLIIAAVIVGGIVGVIVHALRISEAPDTHGLKQVEHLRPARTEPAGGRQKTTTKRRGYGPVSASRG
jgi:sugar phosphate permease